LLWLFIQCFYMEQMLAHIIWLFIQYLYYEAGTGSYAMFGCSIFEILNEN
jgi:hypothetical protein